MTRVDRKRRLDEAKDWAGYRSGHFARSTGTLVVVCNSAEQGLDPDGGKWTLICDDHATTLAVDTLALAKHHAVAPEGWCDNCRGDIPEYARRDWE